MHSCFEIVLVYDGTMHMILDGTDYLVPAGSAVVIEPYEIHSFMDDHPNQSYIIEFMLESNITFWEFVLSHSIETKQIELSHELFSYLIAKLPTDSDRNSGKIYDPSFVQAILAPLCYEFVSLNNHEISEKKNDSHYINTLKQISRMIWQDAQQDMSLSAVAKKLGIHKTTLSKRFSNYGKMTFTESVQYIRVCKAAYLLRQNITISAAADFAGFHCIRSFNRVFRKVTGCTPSDYIQSHNSPSDRYNIAVGFE